MKKMRGIWLLNVILSLIFLMLTACDKPPSGTVPDTSDDGMSVNSGQGLYLLNNGKCNFLIEDADPGSEATGEGINLLRSRFQSNYGVVPQIRKSTDTSEILVIFGNVGDEISERIFEDLRSADYAVKVSDRAVYIAAHTASGYKQAVNRLCSLLIGETDEISGKIVSLIVPEDTDCCFRAIYQLENFSVNDVSIAEYDIFLPENGVLNLSFAKALQNDISVYCGHIPEIVNERKDSGRYITFEIDGGISPLHYKCSVKNGELVFSCGGERSLRLACSDFGRLMTKNNKSGLQEGDLITGSFLDTEGIARQTASDIRIVSCNILAEFQSWTDTGDVMFNERTEIFSSFLQVYDPDIIGVQEFTPSWLEYVSKSDGVWKIACGEGSRSTLYNPIIYRSDRLILIESGWTDYSRYRASLAGRYMTWAVFEVIEGENSGQRLIVVNTHLDGTREGTEEFMATQVRETAEKVLSLVSEYGCPAFCTGDFNDNETAETYSMLKDLSGMNDAKYSAEILLNNIGSNHGFASANGVGTYSFDHIFSTPDAKVHQFKTVLDNQQIYASDHAWIFADINFSE